jgi:hypothetical protein
MFDIHATNWPVAVDSTDPRDQFHERALHEARIATDYHESRAGARPEAVPTGLLARIRLAIAGGAAVSTVEPCNCPA